MLSNGKKNKHILENSIFTEFGLSGLFRNLSGERNECLAQQQETEGQQHCSHLCNDPHAACNDCSLGLSPAHAPEPRGDEHLPGQLLRAQVSPARVQHRQLHRANTAITRTLCSLPHGANRLGDSGVTSTIKHFNPLRRKCVTKWCCQTICPHQAYFSHQEIK